ncbi:YihY/virulence factor BrkB family protein [Streptomyces violascens]|uniref:Ribonuclease n=1 Tax=Streptomyces violascens TaxID=67381 RepID=A0ABQ3QRG9_9ACTN|nr:YihY/virulence factor BrkB family protein [Streptomyces violascens]GGU48864.1 ribonuclease [Streptomyces violascens]GHI39866.1 ribonuclease [Streptomyces violascens]
MPALPPSDGGRFDRTAAVFKRLRDDLRDTALAVWNDNVADCAAALTYYAVLALVPALLVAVSVIGLAAPQATGRLIDDLTSYAPAQSASALRGALREMTAAQSSVWVLVATGTVSALWSAASYLAVFRRALHSMYHLPDNRPALRTAHTIVATALLLLALLLTGSAAIVISGPLDRRAAALLGVDGLGTWSTVRWPVLLCVVTVLVLVLFRTGPTKTRGMRQGLPGGLLAVFLWFTASAGFELYAGHFASYTRLYGSLAGVVVFLVWLWFTNLSLLAGAQFNAVRGRRRSPGGLAPAATPGTDTGPRLGPGLTPRTGPAPGQSGDSSD